MKTVVIVSSTESQNESLILTEKPLKKTENLSVLEHWELNITYCKNQLNLHSSTLLFLWWFLVYENCKSITVN